MADTPGTQQVSLTTNTVADANVMLDNNGDFTPQNVLRSNSAPVDTAHPLPTLDGAAVTQLGFLVQNAVSALTAATQTLAAATATQTNTNAIGNASDAAWPGSGPGSLVAIEKAIAMGGGGSGGSATAANQVAGNISLTTIASAQGGAGSGIVQPTGGTGLLGWLSGIFNNTTGVSTATLQTSGNSTLTAIASSVASGATASGQSASNTLLTTVATNTTGAATAANQATEITSLGTVATAQGVQGTGLNPPSGGSGVLGFLSGIYNAIIAPLTTKSPDVRATAQTLNSATLNAAYTVSYNNGAGMVGFTISGLTASGATLTSEYSNDGSTWSAHNIIGGTFVTTVTADGQYSVNAAGHIAVRFRVSTIGTGTITLASSVTVADSVSILGASLPTGANTIGAVNVNGTVPVSGTVTIGALTAGSAAIGTVGVTALPPTPAGTNAIGSVTSTTPDVRAVSQTINSATLSAAVTVNTNNGAGVVSWVVSGLSASTATLTSEYTNDGSTWLAHNILGNTFTSTITADGSYRVDASGRVGVRLRVSIIGTGTLTISYNESIANSAIVLAAPVPTGANVIGGVTVSGPVNLAPTTTGGLSSAIFVSANTTNITSVKGSAGQVYGAHIESIANATGAYLKFFNKATAPALGTDTPIDQICIPAAGTTSGTGHELQIVNGLAYPLGIQVALTLNIALLDNTAVAANAFNVTVYYK